MSPPPLILRFPWLPNGAADKLRREGTLACLTERQLHPLDGRREAPDRERMAIRSPDGAARSVRAIDALHLRARPAQPRRVGAT
ncbi:MAG: hypothetical protein V1694_00405, partial [Candidatus Eisenbacteria bacterium]